jgi:HlyD family secretion protein
MKKIIILVGVVALIVTLVIFGAKQRSHKGIKVYEEEARKVDRLVTTVKASGEVEPKIFVNISSQVPGQIVDLRTKVGDRVGKGDILLQLDPEQYRSTVTRLEANLRLARINLDKEKTSLTTYESTLRRQQALAKQMIVSADQLEQATLLVESSRIQVRGLEEQIQQASAELVKARDELAKTTIRAPIDGLVTLVNAKLGEQVIIGTMNNPGTVILVLSDMSEMLAEVRVDETEIAAMKPGQKAVVTIDALPGRQFDGVVTEIAHTAIKDKDVSRFTVKVSLAGHVESGGAPATRELPLSRQTSAGAGEVAALRPGMSAHAAVEVASRDKALVVPLQAVFSKKRKDVEDEMKKPVKAAEGPIAAEASADPNAAAAVAAPQSEKSQEEDVDVIFVDRKGKAEMMPVKTGLSDEFNVELIGASIEPGEKIVIGPYRTLKKLKHGEAITKVEKDEDLKEPK